MSGMHCERFPTCDEFSEKPQPPKCTKADCPGNRSWADVFPELKTDDDLLALRSMRSGEASPEPTRRMSLSFLLFGICLILSAVVFTASNVRGEESRPREKCRRWWVDMDQRICHRDSDRYAIPCDLRKNICNY